MTIRVGFIGTGANPDDPSNDGYAMAYRHAAAYQRLPQCELAACADIVPENAAAFADKHGIDERHIYEDYLEMLERANLDVVSVCTPPSAHAPIVTEVARSGKVRAIHCEKPIADTIGDAREMVRVCEEAGVALTINHQYRYGKPYAKAKELLDSGAIGDLRRFEFGHSTLFDMGSHFFDLCNWYNDYTPAEWMLAQVDYTEENRMFGVHNENQAIAQWRYENGVYGLASTGRGDGFNEALFRIVGTEGELRIGGPEGALSMRQDGTGWRTVDTGRDGAWSNTSGRVNGMLKRAASVLPGRLGRRIEPTAFLDRAIETAVVGALEDDEPSPLNARDALASQELVFAAWESVRRRGRVDLPLDIDDNPLSEMVEAGDLLSAET
jgi:predicted dehydrogenase